MPLRVIFISGPPGAGKSTMIRMLAREVLPQPPHYIRLVPVVDGGAAQLRLVNDPDEECLASAQLVGYTPERVFEVLPESLQNVKRKQRFATVLIESTSDPCLRHAYPYDRRIFVMTPPRDVYEVFRRPEEASLALQQVMEDTAAFATEIFGLFEDSSLDDEEGVRHHKRARPEHGVHEELEVSELQVRRFLGTPLGAEIASRIQLQPDYHAMIESDVVVCNMPINHRPCDESAVRRIETLIARVRSESRQDVSMFRCDLDEAQSESRIRLAERLRHLLVE